LKKKTKQLAETKEPSSSSSKKNIKQLEETKELSSASKMRILTNNILDLLQIFFALLQIVMKNRKLYFAYFLLANMYIVKCLTTVYMLKMDISHSQMMYDDVDAKCASLWQQERIIFQSIIFMVQIQKMFDGKTNVMQKIFSAYIIMFIKHLTTGPATFFFCLLVLNTSCNFIFSSVISIMIVFASTRSFCFRFMFTSFFLYSFMLSCMYLCDMYFRTNCLSVKLK
jgi:hypothetical protein